VGLAVGKGFVGVGRGGRREAFGFVVAGGLRPRLAFGFVVGVKGSNGSRPMLHLSFAVE